MNHITKKGDIRKIESRTTYEANAFSASVV